LPSPKLLLRRRLQIPQFRKTPISPDDPRIFDFNAERELIIGEVVSRVFHGYAEAGVALDYILNETAHHEARRLESQKDEETGARLDGWQKILRKVSKMSEAERVEALRGIIERYTRDVAGNFDPRVYRFSKSIVPPFVGATMRPRSLTKMITEPGTAELTRVLRSDGDPNLARSLVQAGTVVFVPTHSSNLDSLAVGEQLVRENLPPAVYGAGKNLFSNPIVSFFMHNLGAYRVDRRIRAPLYKQVLKTYAAVMLERGYHMLFFPGGTRSRSNMIDSRLKLGLAGTAVEAYARSLIRGRPRRIFFVPITINYELVLEAETLVADFLKDQGKARYIIEDDEFSRLDRWYSFFTSLASHEGACVVRFGEALDPFGNPVDAAGRSLAPNGREIDPASYILQRGQPRLDPRRDAGYTRELGRRLAESYRRETVVMTTQLVAHVLFRRLVEVTPGQDLFARMRRRGEAGYSRAQMLEQIGATRDRLLRLVREGEVQVSSTLRTESPEQTLERAMQALKYHGRPVINLEDGQVTAEDPALLFYYQNRLVPWADRLAAPEQMAAAREIHAMEGSG